MGTRRLVALACLPWAVAAQVVTGPPPDLPAVATTALARSLADAAAHPTHVWRDTAPFAGDLVVAYVEIAAGRPPQVGISAWPPTREQIDRVIPGDLGGYPINYGYVPQTVSYDGDPFDALVLGPPIEGGTLVPGAITGLMYMDDEKGYDAKVVLSPLGADGQPISHSPTPYAPPCRRTSASTSVAK